MKFIFLKKMAFDINQFNQNADAHNQIMNQPRNVPQANNRPPPPPFDADNLLSNRNDATLHTLTNFNCDEFNYLYSVVEQANENMHAGGRHPSLTPKTLFLITLAYCKHAMTFQLLGNQFGLTDSYIGRIIESTIGRLAPILSSSFIIFTPFEDLKRDNLLFSDFPSAYGALDASVQPIPKP